MNWETVIGLEIHVQLSTKTKLFSAADTKFGSEQNTQVDLVDLGLPGVLPVVNKEAFNKAIKFGLATKSKINKLFLIKIAAMKSKKVSRFWRKLSKPLLALADVTSQSKNLSAHQP